MDPIEGMKLIRNSEIGLGLVRKNEAKRETRGRKCQLTQRWLESGRTNPRETCMIGLFVDSVESGVETRVGRRELDARRSMFTWSQNFPNEASCGGLVRLKSGLEVDASSVAIQE